MEFINEDGTFAENWHTNEFLPEGVRGEKSLESIRDFPSLAKSFVNAQKMVGADKIAIPGKYATPEDWNTFYTKMGRPETPDKYTFQKPADFPQEIPYDEGMEKYFKERFHQRGISDKQALEIYQDYLEYEKKAFQDTFNSQKTDVEKAYNGLGSDKDTIINKSNKIIDKLLTDPEITKTLKDHLDTNEAGAAMRTILAALYDRTSEDRTGDLGQGGGYADPKMELNMIMAQTKDPNSPLMDKYHPQHADIMRKVQMLNEKIHGKEVV